MEDKSRRIWYLAGLAPLLLGIVLQTGIVLLFEGSGMGTQMLMVFYSVVGIFVYGLWYRCIFSGQETAQSAVGKIHGDWLILAVTGFGLQFGGDYMLVIEQLLFPKAMEDYTKLMDTAGVGALSPVAALYLVVLAPILEELIFRGLTFHYFRRAAKRFWAANLLQALLFGIYHLNLIQGIYTFCLALVLGYAAEQYQTILAPLIMHFIINILGYALLAAEIPAGIYFMLLVAGIVLLCWGLMKMKEGKRKNSSQNC